MEPLSALQRVLSASGPPYKAAPVGASPRRADNDTEVPTSSTELHVPLAAEATNASMPHVLLRSLNSDHGTDDTSSSNDTAESSSNDGKLDAPAVWADDRSSQLSPSSAEQAVTVIFADIPREVIMNDQSKPHRNAGEVMPEGISALLAELDPLDGRDLFLDIGAGVGNVVAQVAPGTNVYQAIGIELREDIHTLGGGNGCEKPARN
ncbi:hypothetical protein PF010_g22089 [Phytophthora fragariae]|uniref:DOT1 domain-containing protein n=1 Tax=Phytophthora fragariae TaxID=53985 RepID=A0A6G0K9Y2_9STRA|nr:hypothetical protein PF010_g22089 [Phytophthora fragariae]